MIQVGETAEQWWKKNVTKRGRMLTPFLMSARKIWGFMDVFAFQRGLEQHAIGYAQGVGDMLRKERGQATATCSVCFGLLRQVGHPPGWMHDDGTVGCTAALALADAAKEQK